MRPRILVSLVFLASLMVFVADVRTDPMPRPAQVSRASIDAGTPNRLVYNSSPGGTLADHPAITGGRIVAADANGLLVANPALTAGRIALVDPNGILTSNAALPATRLLVADASGFPASRAALTANRLVQTGADGLLTENAALTASRALASDGSGFPTASATTATELGHLSGVTSAIQTQLNGKVSAVTDTATVDFTLSGVTISADVLRAALFPKTYANSAGVADQSLSAGADTNINALTGITLPVTTAVNTRVYRVSGRLSTAATLASLQTLRVWSGINGQQGETEVYRAGVTVPASSLSNTIPIGPFEFTPPGAFNVKIGISLQCTQACTVYNGTTATQASGHILIQEVP